jgi:hypothetical protein
MRFRLLVLLCFAASAYPALSQTSVVLAVPLIGQQAASWCWAATSEMVLAYLGVTVQQCTMADIVHNQNNCCPWQTTTAACDQGSTPDAVLPLYDVQDTSTWVNGCVVSPALSFTQLQTQINNGSPLWTYWSTPDVNGCAQGGHFTVESGYEILAPAPGPNGWPEGPINMVVVLDPEPVATSTNPGGTMEVVLYDDWATSGIGYGVHWNDEYDFSIPRQAGCGAGYECCFPGTCTYSLPQPTVGGCVPTGQCQVKAPGCPASYHCCLPGNKCTHQAGAPASGGCVPDSQTCP